MSNGLNYSALLILFAISLTLHTSNKAGAITYLQIAEGIQGIKQIYENVNKVLNMTMGTEIKVELSSNDESRNQEIFKMINVLSGNVDKIGSQIFKRSEEVLKAVYSLRNFVGLEIEMNEYQKHKNQLNIRYMKMIRMTKNFQAYENSTLVDFANTNIRFGSNSISSSLFGAFFTYYGLQKLNMTERYSRIPLIDKIVEEFKSEVRNNVCSKISAQQYFYNDYMEMLLLEAEGKMLIAFSLNILRQHKIGKFTREAKDFQVEQERRVEYISNKLKKVISSSSREIRQCDPEKHVLGQTFDRLTKVYQGVLINEINLNPQFSCRKDCDYYKKNMIVGCYRKDPLCKKEKIHGMVYDCTSDHRRDSIHVSFANDSSRRYNYFETNRGFRYSNMYGIKSDEKESLYISWINGFHSCSYCRCLLDEDTDEADRKFSLDEMVSDVSRNKAVVGVRFVKINHIFHLQILQAKIGPAAKVYKSTASWKTVRKSKNYVEIRKGYYDKVNLGSVISKEPNFIVTGVRIRKRENNLKLEVRISKYDFASGNITSDSSKWISRAKPHRNKLLIGQKVSSQFNVRSMPSSNLYDYVEFDHSDWDSDAAQTTIPLIDIQEVASSSLVPLSGVGLYHKGAHGFGGFVAPKIFSFDYKYYF